MIIMRGEYPKNYFNDCILYKLYFVNLLFLLLELPLLEHHTNVNF